MTQGSSAPAVRISWSQEEEGVLGRGSGTVSETQKPRLALGASHFQSEISATASSGPLQRNSFHLQPKDVRGDAAVDPERVCGEHREGS